MLKFYCEYKNIDPGGYPHVEIKKTRHLFRSLESCMEKKAVFFFKSKFVWKDISSSSTLLLIILVVNHQLTDSPNRIGTIGFNWGLILICVSGVSVVQQITTISHRIETSIKFHFQTRFNSILVAVVVYHLDVF